MNRYQNPSTPLFLSSFQKKQLKLMLMQFSPLKMDSLMKKMKRWWARRMVSLEGFTSMDVISGFSSQMSWMMILFNSFQNFLGCMWQGFSTQFITYYSLYFQVSSRSLQRVVVVQRLCLVSWVTSFYLSYYTMLQYLSVWLIASISQQLKISKGIYKHISLFTFLILEVMMVSIAYLIISFKKVILSPVSPIMFSGEQSCRVADTIFRTSIFPVSNFSFTWIFSSYFSSDQSIQYCLLIIPASQTEARLGTASLILFLFIVYLREEILSAQDRGLGASGLILKVSRMFSSLNSSWANNSSHSILSLSSNSIILLISTFISSSISGSAGNSKGFQQSSLVMISLIGYLPQIIQNSITPNEQISHLWVQGIWRTICGAAVWGVPAKVSLFSPNSQIFCANPKSAILITPLLTRIFCGFTSLCRNILEWRSWNPFRICMKQYLISSWQIWYLSLCNLRQLWRSF